MPKNNGKKLALGALVGAAAGYVTGILTAPKSGKETRTDIKNSANAAKREAEKKLKTINQEISDLVEKGRKQLKIEGDKAKKELQKAMDSARDAQQKVKEVISAIKNGETSEPELKKAIAEATKAKDHLANFFKK